MLLTSHKTNGCNNEIDIFAYDTPGPGGAYHHYGFEHNGLVIGDIYFQKGGIQEVGINGLTNEALLAVVEHRLECFQKEKFACRENAIALTKIQEAMMWLQKRTNDRIKRNVEGTQQV